MSDKKTIAFYIGSLARGGAERVMTNLAAFFCEQGYKVYLVTKMIDEPEYDVPEGVERIIADITSEEKSSSRIKNLYLRINKLRRIWKDIKPDIIVSFIRKNNLMAIASSRGLNIPVYVSIRSNPARELKGKFFKPLSFFLFRFAKGIIVQTKQAKEFMPSYLQAKTVIMPNSLNKQFVEKNLSSHNDKKRKKEIVVVGRIDDNKNQRMILEVFEGIKDSYPEWSLHLYGNGEKQKELSQKYASDSVIFHGQVDNVAKYICDASIFVLPSKQEGMPNALIEAMALGLACISTDCPCGGPADLINSGVNGFLIPVDGAKELKDKIIELIENEELRENIGREATKICDVLHPDLVNKKWLEYLESGKK